MAYSEQYPYSTMTQTMLNYLPSWMTIRMQRDVNGANDTHLAQYLNTIGLNIEDLDDIIKEAIEGFFLDTTDTTAVCKLYSVDIGKYIRDTRWTDIKYYIKMELTAEAEVTEAATLRTFYKATGPTFIIDTERETAYINKGSTVGHELERFKIVLTDASNLSVTIEYPLADLHLQPVWNTFDEIGLLLGLPRLYNEDNLTYQARLKKVFENQRGATKTAVKSQLANMLGIDEREIQVNELSELAFKGTLLDAYGNPTDKLREYAKLVNKQLHNTWDSMNWDEAYWKSLEDQYLGFDYLPHIWDVKAKYCPQCKYSVDLSVTVCPKCGATTTGWEKKDFQSGIGKDVDLAVKSPEIQYPEGDQPFEYYVTANGQVNKDTPNYPEHKFTFKIYAKGHGAVGVGTDAFSIEQVNYTILGSKMFSFDDEIKIKASGVFAYDNLTNYSNTSLFDMSSITQTGGTPDIELSAGNAIVGGGPYIKLNAIVPQFSGGGTGSMVDPFIIMTLADFKKMREDSRFYTQPYHFKQGADIDCLGANLNTPMPYYMCYYDGQGHTFSNFTLSNGGCLLNPYTYSSTEATIKNWTLSTITIDSASHGFYGVFRNYSDRAVNYDTVKISGISGSALCGSLFSENVYGNYSNCSVKGSIIYTTNSNWYTCAGMFSSINGAIITNCYVELAITTPTAGTAGYEVGLMCRAASSSTFTRCHVEGTIESTSGGGFCGTSYYCTFNSCAADVALTGSTTYADKSGGFVAYAYGSTFNNCYATGDVSGVYYVGGFVGQSYHSNYTNCYSVGKVTCVNTGPVYDGGFCAYNHSSYGTNVFWDTETSTKTYSGIGVGKTTAEMKTQSTFYGWDFNTIWELT